jgi:hypothetical protein
MQQTERKPLFDLGQLVATPGALAALEKSGQNPMDFLSRHVTGDWGELSEDDRKENQFSLEKSGSGKVAGEDRKERTSSQRSKDAEVDQFA